MSYTFDILGVSPILYFFNQQQDRKQKQPTGVEYVASYKCSLDALIQSVENISPNPSWDIDKVVDTVIKFWMHNSESIEYWKARLKDAGRENLLVGRVADVNSLRTELELLFDG
ncbi:hypothetical protein [Microseira wollei]|uniref:Uncharacterized protein n=1 Tax=Microseira wollei NIES-4236 TaxID=2530354 RepID=A0AAV3X5B9_9CYAN|nr:hypothetical protein [Microseira wollei]GET36441.1 hypothetical protein Npun_F2360 [Microseira wollei NIES-4236]